MPGPQLAFEHSVHVRERLLDIQRGNIMTTPEFPYPYDTYLPGTLAQSFRTDTPLQAAISACTTAERYIRARIPAMACGGGPALYQAREAHLMTLGVQLAHAQGCEFFGYEQVWIDTFNTIMTADRSTILPAPYEHVPYGTARFTVETCLRHQRELEQGTVQYTIDEYARTGYTPYTWMLEALKHGYRYVSTPFGTYKE